MVEDGGGHALASTILHQPPPTFTTCRLEDPPHARLQLPWVAQARANRSVEVEQQVAVRRIPEVVAVEQVEHLDDELRLVPHADVERLREADVPREVGVVLAQRVAEQD